MTIDSSTFWWVIGIILAMFGTLLGILGRIMWKWAAVKDSRQKIIEDANRLNTEKQAFQTERVAKLEVNTMSQAASMAEGRGHFQILDNKTSELERTKLDKLDFLRHCDVDAKEHARIEASQEKTNIRLDAVDSKIDDLRSDTRQMSERVEGSIVILKDIAAKLVDKVILGSGK